MGVTQIGGAGSRLVTKLNTAGQALVGSAPSLTGASGTTAWGQVSASLSADTLVTCIQALVTVGAGNFSTFAICAVDIGIGGAGSETLVTTAILMPTTNGSTTKGADAHLPVPVRVGAGQRLAVRITDSGISNANTIGVYVYGAPYANVEGS